MNASVASSKAATGRSRTRAAETVAGAAAGPAPDASALPLGAHTRDDGSTSFVVWSPASDGVTVRLRAPVGASAGAGPARNVDLHRDERGYHIAVVPDVPPGTRYTFVLADGSSLPDPASRYQPEGVHGPSEVVPVSFDWRTSEWRAPDLHRMVLYELHVGTFTPEGTLDAAAKRLPALRELGITAVELLPVAQFAGKRNWGYDGVFPSAVQYSYGGPAALKRFVDAAHACDLNVVLDVVYNHLGPEGNYLPSYGPYFTDIYHTPWGAALNFDDAESDEVRRYFIESALQWIDEFRIDALRLDAIHAIIDRSAQPFLLQLTTAVHERAEEQERTVVLIAESDLGDPRVLRSERLGGLDFDAQWLDDFHHSLRAVLTGESSGYYADFGTLGHLARSYQHGFVYTGDYSRFRRRRHGAPAPDILPRQFVVYAQNHDQIGNRMAGDRLTASVSGAQLRLAAAAVLLSPFTPMLFMGEEYGSRTPFPFFVDFSDADLVEAVRAGRKAEFASFAWQGEPPDPQSVETFRSAQLDWDVRDSDGHASLLELHAQLLELRRTAAGIHGADSMSTEVLHVDGTAADGSGRAGVIMITRRGAEQSSILLLNFAAEPAMLDVPSTGDAWRCVLDTAAAVPAADGGRTEYTLGADHRIRLEPHSAVLLLHDEA